jgi:hypothetical protein
MTKDHYHFIIMIDEIQYIKAAYLTNTDKYFELAKMAVEYNGFNIQYIKAADVGGQENYLKLAKIALKYVYAIQYIDPKEQEKKIILT